LILFVLAFDLAFFWQHAADAYHSEFGGHPDEPAHVVTGLFVHDALLEFGQYLKGGMHGSIVDLGRQFANDYYNHYPKIGLGVWPPVFYLVQSAWTLVFGASTVTLLLLMAVLAGRVGLQVYRGLRDEYHFLASALGVALVLSLPLVRTYYGMVMAETLSALFMFGATLAFGDFLDRGCKKDAIWFGVLSTLAILTKGTGLALALAAPLALLWTRKLSLLKRPALWGAVLIIVIFAGPWTYATRTLGAGGWEEPHPSWHYTSAALPYYLKKFGIALGMGALPFFVFGLVAKLRGTQPHRGRWVACAALIISVIVFQSLVPAGKEDRHLIPALPAACMFVVAGLCAVEGWWRKSRNTAGDPAASPARPGLIFCLGAILVLLQPLVLAPRVSKGSYGFASLADTMLSEAPPDAVTLVSSDATGEGMFIAEVALREERPGHIIQRISKTLSHSEWSGGNYEPKFTTDEEVLNFLLHSGITYLVLDDNVSPLRRRENHDQLKRVVTSHPEWFFPLAESEGARGGEIQSQPVRIYKIVPKK
jgi:hypothetical protein